jgi:hypothetical protein
MCRNQAEDGTTQGGFSAARFTYQTSVLPLHIEGYIIYGFYVIQYLTKNIPVGWKPGLQVFYLRIGFSAIKVPKRLSVSSCVTRTD